MKKIITLLSMAALVVMGAMITSCNKMEEASSGHRVNPDGSITYTTTLHMGASTKTVISEGGAHTFKAGDQIAVIYSNGTNTVKATSAALIGKDVDIFNDNRSARFTVTLTEPFAGSEITYVYPASMVKTDGGISYDAFATQDGTLASLAANLDYCRASGSWDGTGDLPTRTLVNQITIGKFTLESGSTPITSSITGMTVSDGTNSYAVTPSSLSAIWVAMTPITAGTVTITANTSTVFYTNKNSISGKTLSAGNIYPVNVTMQESNIVDLSKIYTNFTAQNGQTLTGTLGANVMISIADGATVTLNNATINGVNDWDYEWAGITCVGDATIILSGTNTVKGFCSEYPGIQAAHNYGEGDEYTLTIQGTGSLTASSNGKAAGIGAAKTDDCGNITISGGTIIATGGDQAAGIGGSNYGECGNISISGGTITASGGDDAAGIGSGLERTCGSITISGGTITATGKYGGAGIGSGADGASCGNISISGGTITATGGNKGAGIGGGKGSTCGTVTITSDVTSVTATMGEKASYSIGAGPGGTCGTVTIGGVVGAITDSPYTYPTPPPTGAINGRFTINGSGDQVYFSQGNLQAVCASADADGSTQETWTWQFAEHQYDYIGSAAANTSINGSGSVSVAGTVDLFGWVGTSSYNNNYGIWNNTTANYYGDTKNESLKNDWGHNAITNGGNTADMWRTLTREEWGYMLSTRSGATVNGSNNVRFAKATIRTDATGVKGLLLFPDGATFDDSEASWGVLNGGYENYTTTCTVAQWTALEAKGCVFLPAAGNRTGTTVSDAGDAGAYWTATGSDSKASDIYPYSYRVYFGQTSWGNPQYYSQQQKTYGHSVRLVRAVE